MTMRFNHEAKTGLMVVVCLTVFAALILRVGDYNFFEKGYVIKTQLHFLDGVKVHAPVRLSGVDVGEVQKITILYGDETIVELDLWLKGGVKVRKDSLANVATLGLMGEKFIEIKDGTKAADYAAPGDLITSKDPIRLEEIFDTVKKVGNEITLTAQDARKLINHVDEAVTTNKPKLDNIFANLDATSSNFKEFSQDIKFHPWKVLMKGKEKSREEMEEIDRVRRGGVKSTQGASAAFSEEASSSTAAKNVLKTNFSSKKK